MLGVIILCVWWLGLVSAMLNAIVCVFLGSGVQPQQYGK